MAEHDAWRYLVYGLVFLAAAQRHLVLPSLRIDNVNYYFYLVLGRFPAELGPETPLNGSGSTNGAEITHN